MSSEVVTLEPVTGKRILVALGELGLKYAVTPKEANIFVQYEGFAVYVTYLDNDENGLCWAVTAHWHRKLNVAYIATAKNVVQAHASSVFAPRLYFKVSDDGYIKFVTSWRLSFAEEGATDQQILDELRIILAATAETMVGLDHYFADPWMNVPEGV